MIALKSRFEPRISWGILCLALGLALGSVAEPGLGLPDEYESVPRFRGVLYTHFSLTEPRPLRAHVVEIDLEAPGIEFVVTPDNGDRPKETDGLRTGSFLKKMKCQMAINANPFAPVKGRDGSPKDVLGLLVDDGRVVSKAEGKLPALLIGSDQSAMVAAPPFELRDVQYAVGGFSIVLKDGVVVGRDDALHPRTAAGVSVDGRTLYLLVVDGRQKGFSEGATTAELGVFLRYLGAADGINLDGGGTTTMVFETDDGKAETVNRPIDKGIPGLERVSGGHLGVRAKTADP